MENINENLNPVEDSFDPEAPLGRRPDGTPRVAAPQTEEVAPEPTPEVAPEAITVDAPAPVAEEVPALGSVGDNAIGSTTHTPAPKPQAKSKVKATEEKVVVYSTKNVTWSEVGKVYRGFNVVTKEAADQWLTRSHIRAATDEEVAKEFGK